MSHLKKSELAWVNHLESGDSIFFVSNKNNVDTIIIYNKIINNSFNPFYLNTIDFIPKNIYTATGIISFRIRKNDKWQGGHYGISRDPITYELSFFANLFDFHKEINVHKDFYYKEKDFKDCKTIVIDSIRFNNCLLFDDLEYSSLNEPEKKVIEFIINKDYGLLLYKYSDGEIFKRDFSRSPLN